MRAVAKRHGPRVFACAPSNRRGFGDLDLFRLQAGSFVRTVTEWLTLRAPTSAPPISAGLNLLDDGAFLKNQRLSHLAGRRLKGLAAPGPVWIDW